MTLRKVAAYTGEREGVTLEAKVYRDTEWGEFRVTLSIGGMRDFAATYHTDDREDAIETARRMVGWPV